MKTTIKREEMDRREVDVSDVVSGRRLLLVHPGAILRDEFLSPMDLSVYRLAKAIKVSRPRVERSRARAPRRHDRHRTAPGALFRDDAGVLDQPSDPLRSRRRRTHSARQDRTGDRAVRRVTNREAKSWGV